MKGSSDGMPFGQDTQPQSELDVRRIVQKVFDEAATEEQRERRGGLRLPAEAGCWHDWQKTNFALGWPTNWGFERGPKVELCSKCGVLRIDQEEQKKFSN